MTWGFITLLFIGAICLLVWVDRAKPDAQMRKKYPFSVIHRMMFLPGSSWRNGIEIDDVPHLQRYRNRFQIFLLSLAILLVAYLTIVFSIGLK